MESRPIKKRKIVDESGAVDAAPVFPMIINSHNTISINEIELRSVEIQKKAESIESKEKAIESREKELYNRELQFKLGKPIRTIGTQTDREIPKIAVKISSGTQTDVDKTDLIKDSEVKKLLTQFLNKNSKVIKR